MLFIGSLRQHKGLKVIIEGFAAANLEGWVLAILGEGPLHDGLETIVRRRGLGGRVFLGRRVPQCDLISVAASADMNSRRFRVGYTTENLGAISEAV